VRAHLLLKNSKSARVGGSLRKKRLPSHDHGRRSPFTPVSWPPAWSPSLVSNFGKSVFPELALSMPLSGLPRNVQVYDLADPGGNRVLVAGLMQLNTTTVADLYRCLDICFQVPQSPNFRLVNVHGIVLDRNPGNSIVPVEDYAVISGRLPLILFSDNWSR